MSNEVHFFDKKIQSDKCGMKFMDLEYKPVKTMFDSQRDNSR
jgi:hypothetical protein